jgi:CheY-like chemotaxis protein
MNWVMSSLPRALVVDDVRANRMILRALLEEEGFDVSEAANGIEAVSVFRSVRPVLVLMDVILPKLDGFAATRVIKELAGDDFATVIMVTSLVEDNISRGVESGADDFIMRPFKAMTLRARLAVWKRVRDLMSVVRGQRDALVAHEEAAEADRGRVLDIFKRIIGQSLPPGVDAVASPATIFNGDVVLAVTTPRGTLRVLLGDFTGHGLIAAMGALPAAETFREATRAGATLEELALALDKRLLGLLPVGMFFAVVLVDLDVARGRAAIVNLGMPPVLHLTKGIVRSHASSGPPLGIPIGLRDVMVSETTIGADSVFVACTDGAVEAAGSDGRAFEIEGVIEALKGVPPDEMLQALREALKAHAPGRQNDDISFAVIGAAVGGRREAAPNLNEPMVWNLDARALRDEQTLPTIMEAITSTPRARHFGSEVQTVLAELFANSLDYGVLGLSSANKRKIETFSTYMNDRAAALDRLESGFVRIEVSFDEARDRLVLELEDSGAGFDFEGMLGSTLPSDLSTDLVVPSGRGISLVGAIVAELSYDRGGSRVRATLSAVAPQPSSGSSSPTADAPARLMSVIDAILSTALRGMLIEDDNRTIVAVNQVFCDVFRIKESPTSLVGRSCLEVLAPAIAAVADPDAFVARVNMLARERAPILHDDVDFADGSHCHRDYHPLVGGLHMWSYRPASSMTLMMPDQVDLREEDLDHDLSSRFDLARLALERLVPHHQEDSVAQLARQAVHGGYRMIELMDVMRLIRATGRYEAVPLKVTASQLADRLRRALSDSNATVEVNDHGARGLTTWVATIEGVLRATAGGYSRIAPDDIDGVHVAIGVTGGGIVLGRVKIPTQWAIDEGETLTRVRTTVASMIALRVGGGLEREQEHGMDTWTFWVPMIGRAAGDAGGGEHERAII